MIKNVFRGLRIHRNTLNNKIDTLEYEKAEKDKEIIEAQRLVIDMQCKLIDLLEKQLNATTKNKKRKTK